MYVRSIQSYKQKLLAAQGLRGEMKSTFWRKWDESSYKCLKPTKRHKTLITTGQKRKREGANTLPPPQNTFFIHIHKYIGSLAVTRYLKRNEPHVCPMAGLS